MKITATHIAAAYRLGREFFEERISRKDAREALVVHGMNAASADYSIGNLRQMLNGAEYNKAMSIAQTRFFLESIQNDYGASRLANAVAALEKHIPYLQKSNRSRLPGLTSLLVEFRAKSANAGQSGDALNDIDAPPPGAATPDRALRVCYAFNRNPNVRRAVIDRSRGRCEYCHEKGFLMANGTAYVETHHIIALSQQGPDTVENVIALCPNHHREAHFSAGADKLEREFLKILAELTEKANHSS